MCAVPQPGQILTHNTDFSPTLNFNSNVTAVIRNTNGLHSVFTALFLICISSAIEAVNLDADFLFYQYFNKLDSMNVATVAICVCRGRLLGSLVVFAKV